MVKLAFFDCDKDETKYLRENLKLRGAKLKFFESELDNRNVGRIKNYSGIIVFIDSKISEEILEKLPKLKFIVTMSTGFDHIDLVACKKRGIKVSNVPSYGENTVAEHAFGLILSLSKKIPESVNRTRDDNFSLVGLEGFDLKGKTLGVIGLGNIGENIVKIAKGFGMKVIVHKRTKDMHLARKFGFSYASLNKLLKNSDVVTLHVPLNNGTYHLINMENVKIMKKGCYLINTSRGEVIDTTALLYGLDKKIIAGAGLDVLEGECDVFSEERELLKKKSFEKCDFKVLLESHRLLKDKNVIVTPHSAFYTKEAVQRIMDTTIDNVLSLSKGGGVNLVGK